ncbi:branched-chain amino acid ABC transporter ATP-binding protein/permease [Halalkalibacter krulwichiae]|uniref:Xylose import ATP-binding protein XylG n=1 Tax=Halalkalibacter krulwichiae TaxID=199441 RepID=A0A1X9MC57_9BACI|nr:branched-chain amino acid ABC transporter ATP-binding protein/permease [Halalkalibacter krulwichiae]ARK29733.1 Xylose import ATP-binding protein XylG [Halalkalibacter krulwichiae]
MKHVMRILDNPISKIVILLLLVIAPLFVSQNLLQLLIFWGIFIILAQSINILTGFAGQLSLGHAAFYAIGAYTSAILMMKFGLPLFITIIISMVLSAIVGFILSFPAGRVKEFYLAMMTLGFGFLVHEIIREWASVTGGVMGISGINSPKFGTLTIFGISVNLVAYYWFVLAITLVIVWLLRNFVQSYFGRSFLAVHQSELAASSIGISPRFVKQLAYTVSAAMAGLAGALYAHLMGYIGPESFEMMKSIEILVMGILGGFGTIIGPILGAAFLTFIPSQLQLFAEYQLMIYGLLLVFSFLIIPKGFAGLLGLRTDMEKGKTIQKLTKIKSKADQSIQGESPDQEQRLFNILNKKLVVDNLVKDFQGLRALDQTSLGLQPGTILGLIGPNGSGKSTLVNLISGVYPVTEGKISFGGKEITNLPSHLIAREGIIRTFQDPNNVPNMTVKENLLLGSQLLFKSNIVSCSINSKSSLLEEKQMIEKVYKVMELCNLKEYADEQVENLPYGIQRMVEVARAILAEPQLLMLDEPAAGLSEEEMDELVRMIRYVKEKGISVILIDHHIDFLVKLVDTVVVLDSGKVIYSGDVEGMQSNKQVIEAYLGVENNA